MPNYPRRKAKANQRLAATPDIANNVPKLTAKQESFALAILEGKTAREAYRLAYDCENMGEASIAVESSRLARKPQIALFIRAIQRNSLESIGISRDSHLSELARLREIAVENQQISAGVQAEHYRGRVAGLYNDKLALTIGPSDEAILSQLASLLGPELARVVGEGLGAVPAATDQMQAPGDNSILSLPPPYDTTE